MRGHHVSYLGTFHEEFHEEYAVAVGFTEHLRNILTALGEKSPVSSGER